MKTTLYKALDVREYVVPVDATFTKDCGGISGKVFCKNVLTVVIIAQDMSTDKRVRIECEPVKYHEGFTNPYYTGYDGDYQLIVPGDVFEVQETNKAPRINIWGNT